MLGNLRTRKARRLFTGIGAAILVIFTLTAESCDGGGDSDNQKSETEAVDTGFDRVSKSQQVPVFDFSQERETLINAMTIRAEGTHGTAYAKTLEGELLWWCPSVGAPVPSTYQLTNPDRIIGQGGQNGDGVTIALGEPTGVYTGDSAATWVVCVDDNGTGFAMYEEANVGWTSGVVNGLPPEKRARVDEITFAFSTTED